MKYVCFFAFLLAAMPFFAQEPNASDKIQDKVVIGFPGISHDQLDKMKTEFAKYPQIISARYFEKHECVLITFDPNEKKFTVYAELLKKLDEYSIYDTKNCYFKVKASYNKILENSKPESEFTVK